MLIMTCIYDVYYIKLSSDRDPYACLCSKEMCVIIQINVQIWGDVMVCVNNLRWLFHPTAEYWKIENMGTYGMRPHDCSSVSEMCYLLIVVWLCIAEAV